jgi:hypothetical protein
LCTWGVAKPRVVEGWSEQQAPICFAIFWEVILPYLHRTTELFALAAQSYFNEKAKLCGAVSAISCNCHVLATKLPTYLLNGPVELLVSARPASCR